MIRTLPDISEYSDLYVIELDYKNSNSKVDKAIHNLWNFVEIEDDSDGTYRPVFHSSASQIVDELQELNTHLDNLDSDIITLKDIFGDYRSLAEMARTKTAAQRAISSANDTVQRAASGAIKRGVAPGDVASDERVRAAELSKDRIESEFSSKVKDLGGRMEKIRDIMESYNNDR